MGFKKIKYHTGDGLMKVKIEDDSGATIESWTIMFSDFLKWVDIMKRKYGFPEHKKDRDLDWIK